MFPVPGADEQLGFPGPEAVNPASRPVQAALRSGQVGVRAALGRRPDHGFRVGRPRGIAPVSDVAVLGEECGESGTVGHPPLPQHDAQTPLEPGSGPAAGALKEHRRGQVRLPAGRTAWPGWR
jgi:hypothetical protein